MNDHPEYPDPTPEDLASPEFEAVWQAIKDWDLRRCDARGYAGATGNDVMHILRALRSLAPRDAGPAGEK